MSDQASAQNLSTTSSQLARDLAELRTAITYAQEACMGGPMELEYAIRMIQSLDSELQETQRSLTQGRLYPLPGETVSFEIALIGKFLKN